MSKIVFENVGLEYPILDRNRSFRAALGRSLGGAIRRAPHSRHASVVALEAITVSFVDGDRVGLIGRNGAGKSTMLKAIAGIYPTTAGRLTVTGRVTPLLAIGVGLDLEETGYENIVTCGLFNGLTPAEVRARQDEIAEFTELGDFLSLPLRTYSLGMQMRLGFAIATSGNPEILLLDEVIGAGDQEFAAKARERMNGLMQDASIIVLASHDAELIESCCNKALWLDGGHVVEFGPVHGVLSRYHAASAGATRGEIGLPAP